MKYVMIAMMIACLTVVGCKKKEAPAVPSAPEAPATSTVEKTVEQAVTAAQETAEKAVETVKAAAAKINLEASVEQLKAEADKMDVAALKATATTYLDEIKNVQTQLTGKMEKLAAIPLADKMSAEAQALGTDIKNLTGSLASLKERFAMYVDMLKTKGGDASGLTLP